MNRTELISILETVAYGLERNNIIPIYEHFCFTGETVFAFHDAFGVIAPYKVKSPFAVNGPTLLKLLQASKASDLNMSVTKEGLVINTGSSEYTIPIKTKDEFAWSEPEFPSFELGSDVISGIISCLPTCSDNLALEVFNRVCIKSQPPDHRICVYATDGDALTKYTTDLLPLTPGDIDFCLSHDFCESLTKIDFGKASMKVGPEWVYVGDKGTFRVYGPNLGPTTLDYEVEITKSLGEKISAGLTPIPDKLFDQALTRARVVADIETSTTTLAIDNKEMFIQTLTPFGDVLDDSISVNHPNIEINVNAKLIQTSMQGCDKFKLTPNSSVFMGDKILRLVANIGK